MRVSMGRLQATVTIVLIGLVSTCGRVGSQEVFSTFDAVRQEVVLWFYLISTPRLPTPTSPTNRMLLRPLGVIGCS